MSTIRLHQTTTLTPEQYVAGLTDFGPGRSKRRRRPETSLPRSRPANDIVCTAEWAQASRSSRALDCSTNHASKPAVRRIQVRSLVPHHDHFVARNGQRRGGDSQVVRSAGQHRQHCRWHQSTTPIFCSASRYSTTSSVGTGAYSADRHSAIWRAERLPSARFKASYA